MDIILASASPRRRELMKLITENFQAVSMDADETLPDDIAEICRKTPEFSAQYLSSVKAEAAYLKYPDSLIIGCDTVVISDGIILGKPKDSSQCHEYLKMLSGKPHKVTTGCTLIFQGKKTSFHVDTTVFFRELSDEEIEWYISTGEPFDKAGGYGIQGKGALLIESISGDYFNVVGLPVSALYSELKKYHAV